jgi:hypothetical protein
MTSHPPRVATWILRTLGSGPEIEALLGDLCEAYATGRSRAWFWWQVLLAIPVTFADTVHAHPFLIARALGAGWLALMSVSDIAPRVIGLILFVGDVEFSKLDVPAYAVIAGVRTTRMTSFDKFGFYWPALVFVITFVAAWIASRLVVYLHRRVGTAAMLAFTTMLVLLWVRTHLRTLTFGWYPLPEVYRPDVWWWSPTWTLWSPLLAQVSGSLLGGLRLTQRSQRRRERGGGGWSPA